MILFQRLTLMEWRQQQIMFCRQKYKLSRPFLFVNKEESLTDAGQQFIDFILSPDGQAVVSETGAIPVQ